MCALVCVLVRVRVCVRVCVCVYVCVGLPPCGLSTVPRLDVAPQHRPLGGFAVGRVRTGDLYGLVRTDYTGKQSEHIYAPDQGPKGPS